MSTLPTDKQEIFDIVCNHLRGMKHRSQKSNGMCAYRGVNGMKCAVGVLIPDDIYSPDFDNLETPSIHCVVRFYPSKFKNWIDDIDLLDLLKDLQSVHDSYLSWGSHRFVGEDRLKNIAEKYNLKYTTPSQQ